LQNLPGNEDKARRLAEYSAWRFRSGQTTGLESSWWINAFLACAEAQLGRIAESLAALDRVRRAQGLVRSPLILDSPCFKPLAREPGYQALVARLEERQAELRARLPATLAEHGVADVRP
jgi:hypothetical protein